MTVLSCSCLSLPLNNLVCSAAHVHVHVVSVSERRKKKEVGRKKH